MKSDLSTVDLKYYMLTAQQQYFVPLGGAYTLALNAMADWGQSYGGKDYPIIKTVYAGGIGTVRGYEGSSLGARDPVTGDYLGGTRRVVTRSCTCRSGRVEGPHAALVPVHRRWPGVRGQRPVFTTGKSSSPVEDPRLAFLGGYWPVVAIADGSVAAVVCPTAQRQAGRRQAGIPVPDRNRFLLSGYA